MESTNTPAIKAAADTERDLWNKWATAATSDGLITIADMHGSLSGWLARAALATPAIQAVVPILTAKQRFDAHMGTEDVTPIERLRFFCSLAMSGQDWLDVEPFFDALAAPAAPVAPDLASLTRYLRVADGSLLMAPHRDGPWIQFADEERLLSHTAKAPVEPVSALTDEQILQALSEITHEVPKHLPPGWLKFARAIESKLLVAGPKVEPVSALTDEQIVEVATPFDHYGDEDETGYFDALGFARALLVAGPKVESVSEDKRDASCKCAHIGECDGSCAPYIGKPQLSLTNGLPTYRVADPALESAEAFLLCNHDFKAPITRAANLATTPPTKEST